MKLLIDAGNSLVKWALVNGDDWLCQGVLPTLQADRLSLDIAERITRQNTGAGLQDIQQIWASNVAGETCAGHIRNIGTARTGQPNFIAAQKFQCGVINGYTSASQLGSDRWAALIAAWHLVKGTCLVVNSGTATTIDALSAQGEFTGGLIVPGIELMQRSLVAATDQLQSATGVYSAFPRNSADAIYSGAIQAVGGAIERQYALLGSGDAPVILSGGAAGLILPYLNQTHFGVPARVVDNLVLHGLRLIALEAD